MRIEGRGTHLRAQVGVEVLMGVVTMFIMLVCQRHAASMMGAMMPI